MSRVDRRRFLATAAGLVAALPAFVRGEENRPKLEQGVASGDVHGDSAIVWSRTDRPARMFVEWSTTEKFGDARKVFGPAALPEDDFTARVALDGLPPGETIFYRVTFRDLASPKIVSAPVVGRFRTPSREQADVLFAWSGDTVGQGWGINTDWGGLKIYETMRKREPHFFVHSGDNVYADNPLSAEVKLDGGAVWKNVVTPAKAKVAETLEEFRGQYLYNLLDENYRRFNAEVPLVVQWDDHEVRNNWYPGQMLDDARYKVKSCSLLAARAMRAFREYLPLRPFPGDQDRIYRSFSYGPLLDVFVLDQRTYRGPNTANKQKERSEETAFHGDEQLAWLKRGLKASKATWKVIASDMPIGLIVGDSGGKYENAANGNGPPLGRELEFVDLFSFMKREKVRNVIWLTADVHYAAAHYYDPEKAQFHDFDGFWEFVAGPLHAGTFGPGTLDNTFGPRVEYCSVEKGKTGGKGPAAGMQFFGTVKIDGKSEAMTVGLCDLAGKELYKVELPSR